MLVVDSLSKQFRDSLVFSDLSLSVSSGERLAIIGPSGSGKTTLLKCIAGLLQPEQGSIRTEKSVFNEDLFSLPAWQRQVGMVFQDLALWPHLTVAEHVSSVLRWTKTPVQARAAKLDDILSMLEIQELRSRYPEQLSGGQQQRLAFARLFAGAPKIILLDEAFKQMDERLRTLIWDNLQSLQDKNDVIILFTSHNKYEVEQYATNVFNMPVVE